MEGGDWIATFITDNVSKLDTQTKSLESCTLEVFSIPTLDRDVRKQVNAHFFFADNIQGTYLNPVQWVAHVIRFQTCPTI